LKRVLSFFVPGGILFLAANLGIHVHVFERHLDTLNTVYPYVTFIVCLLMGWRFNRSSLVFGVIVLASALWALLLYPDGRSLPGTGPFVVYHAVTLLLPVNLVVVSCMKERGIFTVHGGIRAGFIALQVLVLAMFVKIDPAVLFQFMQGVIPGKGWFPHMTLNQLALFLIGCSFAILLFGNIRNSGAKEHGFFWALATVLPVFGTALSIAESMFLFSTAGLILLVAMIEASYAMAFRDELTGLPARRALKEEMMKLSGNYTLAMVDIDHFKRFNDQHGHDVGDQVLRMVASRLAKISGGGKAFRYGGEEFTVVFPGRHSEHATEHLEQFRKEIASTGFAIRSLLRPRKKPTSTRKRKRPTKRVHLTLSVGVATKNDHLSSVQDVINAADKALYRAKKQGRNRVVA